jgi:cobalt-zinc-cadmium resistance protein CzcA
VAEAQAAVNQQVALPSGYEVTWGGQFKNLQEASSRLLIAVPAALFLILALLFTTFNSARLAALIFFNVPMAASGGIVALWLRGLPFSISAGVGFIALFGVAVLNGVVLINHIVDLRQSGAGLKSAVYDGAMTRMRPVLMTALVAILGFIPMATSTSAGAEVQRPLATVVIGGLITSTLLTLFVLPAIYRMFEPKNLRRAEKPERDPQGSATRTDPTAPVAVPAAHLGRHAAAEDSSQEERLAGNGEA